MCRFEICRYVVYPRSAENNNSLQAVEKWEELLLESVTQFLGRPETESILPILQNELQNKELWEIAEATMVSEFTATICNQLASLSNDTRPAAVDMVLSALPPGNVADKVRTLIKKACS